MINVFGFSRKYLTRKKLINTVDNNKIWNKTLTVQEIKEILNKLESELSRYYFEIDENFIINSRRKVLKEMIETRFQNNDEYRFEKVLDSLFNFWEYVNDEYSTITLIDREELGISLEEFYEKDKKYREKGIICTQEKDEILQMIQIIRNNIVNYEKHN